MLLTWPGKFSLPLAALFLAGGSAALADTLSGPSVGVTPYGMGRAQSAIADDWLSLYYNPAGLALVKRVDLQVFDLRLESNSDVIHSYQDVKSLSTNSQSTLAGSINSLAGKNIMGDVSNVSQITIPHFALSFVYDQQVDFELQNLAYPITSATYIKDTYVMAGTGWSIGKQQDFRIGASLRWIDRTGGSLSIPISEIMGNTKSIESLFSQSGTGYGGDLGMQYRLPIPGQVEYTTSFVWHDIGDTSFGSSAAVNPPTRIEQDMVGGIAIRFPIGGNTNRRARRRYGQARSTSSFSIVADYDHINTPLSQVPLAMHLHTGVNLDLPIFSFQLGLNQSALTYGTSFDIGLVRVNLASYGEELGYYAGQKVDRRYLLSLGSDFGFSTSK
jgi:hypothetical protein